MRWGLFIRICSVAFLSSSLILTHSLSGAVALTSAEATQKLDACIAAINDPLYTRATLPGLMGYANAAALESVIASDSLKVWVATGPGVISGSGAASGQGRDLFCGDGNNNDVATMDSFINTQDFFFGGGGNDRVTGNMWFSTFYGGPGDDYVATFDEASSFYGGPGNDTYGTLLGQSYFEQGTEPDLTAPTFPSAETFNVAENSSVVGILTTSESATISLDSGEDKTKFVMTRLSDSSTTLSFITPPNYESPTDAGLNNIYIVIVKAVDSSSNVGYETITITISDVIDTSEFISFALTGNPRSVTYRLPINLVAVVTVASRVTFTVNQKRIAGCISKLTTGSGTSHTATCSWRPSQRGLVTLSSQSSPTGAGITPPVARNLQISVVSRNTKR